MPIACPSCAQWIADGQTLCPNCGANVNQFSQAEPGPYQGFVPPPYGEPGAFGGRGLPYVPQGRRNRARANQEQPAAELMQQSGAQPVYAQPMQQSGPQPVYAQPMQQSGAQPVYGQPMQQSGPQPVYAQPMQQSGAQPVPGHVSGFQQSGAYPPVDAASYQTGRFQPVQSPKKRAKKKKQDRGVVTGNESVLENFVPSLERIRDIFVDHWYYMGFGNRELDYNKDIYEERRILMPECVTACEGEQPIRQYKLAVMRNRVLGVTSAMAKGSLQVTTHRVIFRAAGRTVTEATSVQHEVDIDEVAAVEARSERSFLRPAFVMGVVCMLLAALACFLLFSTGTDGAKGIYITVSFIASLIVFLAVHEGWLIKAAVCGGVGLAAIASSMMMQGSAWGLVVGGVCLLGGVIALWMSALKPNLMLTIRTHGGEIVLDVQRDTLREKHSGFAEVEPAMDAERCIREITAIIRDVQELGVKAAEKWRIG